MLQRADLQNISTSYTDYLAIKINYVFVANRLEKLYPPFYLRILMICLNETGAELVVALNNLEKRILQKRRKSTILEKNSRLCLSLLMRTNGKQ